MKRFAFWVVFVFSAIGCETHIELDTVKPVFEHEEHKQLVNSRNEEKSPVEEVAAIVDDGTAYTEAAGSDFDKDTGFDKLDPFFESNIVFDESFWLVGDEQKCARFLFNPGEIISVKKHSTGEELVDGVDYIVGDGYLCAGEGGSVMTKTTEEMFPEDSQHGLYSNPIEWLANHVTVTYKHSGLYEGFEQQDKSDKLRRIYQKLDAGQNVKIGIIGDSISDGADSSWYDGVLPGSKISPAFRDGSVLFDGEKWIAHSKFANQEHKVRDTTGLPYWALFVFEMAKQYPGQTVEFMNRSLPGLGVTMAAGDIHPNVIVAGNEIAEFNPDLVIEGFGANDASSFQTESNYKLGTKRLIDIIRQHDETIDIVLIGTHVANTDWDKWGGRISRYTGYLQALIDFENELDGVVVADMTNTSLDIMDFGLDGYVGVKEVHSVYANNINHGADWWHTIYAQIILRSAGLR